MQRCHLTTIRRNRTVPEPATYYVYGLQAIGQPTGPVKIGFSRDPITRLKALQPAASGTRLHVLFQVEAGPTYGDGRRLEHLYHKRFTSMRMNGEWFQFDPAMLMWTPGGARRVYRETAAPAVNTVPAPRFDIGDSAIFDQTVQRAPTRTVLPDRGDLSDALRIQKVVQPINGASQHTAASRFALLHDSPRRNATTVTE